jgi:hypothetical protein
MSAVQYFLPVLGFLVRQEPGITLFKKELLDLFYAFGTDISDVT